MNNTTLYNVDEMAEFLRVSRQTVYRRVADGTLPHIRTGRRIQFEADAIEKWINDSIKRVTRA